MNVGMLWLDPDTGRSLEEKVLRAATYYQEKYGQSPQLCYVNVRALAEPTTVGSVQVKPANNVLPSHLWLGIEAQDVSRAPD